MPISGGLSATTQIREIEHNRDLRRAPVTMVSTNLTKEHITQSFWVGCDFHIAKPVTPAVSLKAIDSKLEACAASQRAAPGKAKTLG
jgi:CheY-like chemotaxis protein